MMEPETLLHAAPRTAHRPIQLVLVRANGPLFYSLTAASLLESSMPLAADRMLHFFGSDAMLAQWIRAQWLPRKEARARQLREYIQSTWPEYDWFAGLEQYGVLADTQGSAAPYRPTAAHEALARCVAAAQSGVYYRSLARWADDPRLRELARAMAQEDTLSFAQFRSVYDRRLRVQGFGCTEAWTTALACVRSVRDSQVPRAFDAINSQCAAHVPFPVLEYPEFVSRMTSVIERHGNLGTPERVLLRTWRKQTRAPRRDVQRPRPAWFRPVFHAAA
jgi:hypothetical protein